MFYIDQGAITVTQGDTGTVSFSADRNFTNKDKAMFTVATKYGKVVLKKDLVMANDSFDITFTHEDTRNLPSGQYEYDIRFMIDGEDYITPQLPAPFTVLRAIGRWQHEPEVDDETV